MKKFKPAAHGLIAAQQQSCVRPARKKKTAHSSRQAGHVGDRLRQARVGAGLEALHSVHEQASSRLRFSAHTPTICSMLS